MFYEDDRRKIVDELSGKPVDRQAIEKSREAVEKGEAYASLVESRGWKYLMEEFIKPRLSRDRFLNADREELPFVQTEMKVLMELLNFIDSRINQARIEARLLEKYSK